MYLIFRHIMDTVCIYIYVLIAWSDCISLFIYVYIYRPTPAFWSMVNSKSLSPRDGLRPISSVNLGEETRQLGARCENSRQCVGHGQNTLRSVDVSCVQSINSSNISQYMNRNKSNTYVMYNYVHVEVRHKTTHYINIPESPYIIGKALQVFRLHPRLLPQGK